MSQLFRAFTDVRVITLVTYYIAMYLLPGSLKVLGLSLKTIAYGLARGSLLPCITSTNVLPLSL